MSPQRTLPRPLSLCLCLCLCLAAALGSAQSALAPVLCFSFCW
ncbi:MSRB3 isoform 3 [Pongo abelii]|uniref:MSRB3 isoform 3 n=1 Tax=Pongo abelii TaxID=9601 RepID=A0A2J8W0R2_PONAB|nr:MSRB3 isoform 3 [Pongo abelii]